VSPTGSGMRALGRTRRAPHGLGRRDHHPPDRRADALPDGTVERARASRARHGVPDWQLDAWVSTYTAIAAGEVAAITDDVRRLTGREPLSLERLLAR